MSKTKVTRKAVSTKEKAREYTTPAFMTMARDAKPSNGVKAAIDAGERCLEMRGKDGDFHGAEAFVRQSEQYLAKHQRTITLMKKSKDAQLLEIANDLKFFSDALVMMAKAFRGSLAKAESRAAEMEGR